MPTYGIHITDTASPSLQRLARGLSDRTYGGAVGEAGKAVLMDHFASKEQAAGSHKSAQKLNAKPSGLYAQFARSTGWTLSRTGVTLSVHHVAARQRYHGGTLTPSGGRTYLTIPALAAAYGVRARDAGIPLRFTFALDPDLQVMRPALVADDPILKAVGAKRKDGSRRQKIDKPEGVWYWLVKSVTQKPDPTVLPEMDVLAQGVTDALSGWLEEVQHGG